MDNKQAIIKLQNIKGMIVAAIVKVDRRKWRNSEKAMTKSEYQMQIEAIEMAIREMST